MSPYIYLTDEESLSSLIEKIKEVTIIAADTEVKPNYEKHPKASWKDPHTSEVRLIQLYAEEWDKPYIVDVLKIGKDKVKPLILELSKANYKKIFHNASYDLKVIRGTFGIWLENVTCTMVMMQRIGLCTGLKSSKLRKHSYSSLAINFFNIEISKVEQDSDWSAPELSQEQLLYAALDVTAPKDSGIKSILIEAYRLFNEALKKDYKVDMPLDLDLKSMSVVAKIEYNGIPVSEDTLELIMEDLKKKVEDMKIKIAKMLNLPVSKYTTVENGVLKIKEVVSADVSKILNNPKKMVDLINKVSPTKLPDLKKESLNDLLNSLEDSSNEIIETLIEYKKMLKVIGTDYTTMINPITGCLHSQYKVIGASSGRMSSGKSDMGEEDTFNAQQLSNTVITIPDRENPFKSNSSKVIM